MALGVLPSFPTPCSSGIPPPRYDRVEGLPHIQVAVGPRGTNSSLDDTGVRVVMPTWEQNSHELYIPEDQPLSLAADR